MIGFVTKLGPQADVITLELWSLAPRHSHTLARGRQLGLNNYSEDWTKSMIGFLENVIGFLENMIGDSKNVIEFPKQKYWICLTPIYT